MFEAVHHPTYEQWNDIFRRPALRQAEVIAKAQMHLPLHSTVIFFGEGQHIANMTLPISLKDPVDSTFEVIFQARLVRNSQSCEKSSAKFPRFESKRGPTSAEYV